MKYQHEDLLHVAFELVREERGRQIASWGNQCHDDPDWNLILGEERGEVEKAILEHRLNNADPDEIEIELVQRGGRNGQYPRQHPTVIRRPTITGPKSSGTVIDPCYETVAQTQLNDQTEIDLAVELMNGMNQSSIEMVIRTSLPVVSEMPNLGDRKLVYEMAKESCIEGSLERLK